MKRNPLWLVAAVILFGCSEQLSEGLVSSGSLPISLTGSINQQNLTRANEQGFVTGDRMGIYIVDYVDGRPGQISTDNRASNVIYTFDGENYRWTAPTTIYWRDNTTPVDVYGYYPAANYISDPSAFHFEVSADQSLQQEGEMSSYEASDFLWGKTAGTSPTTETIMVRYSHRLAGVRVQLLKGDGLTDTEWQKLPRLVTIDNTIRTATIDLATGTSTPTGSNDRSIRMLEQSGDYRAVVIPQTVEAGKALISITIDGIAYSHKLTSPMKYQAGKLHNFTITVNKSEASGDYSISVCDDGITDWINDEASHQFTAMAYVTVHCPQYGRLKQCITDAGYDYKTVQNLKVTGEITDADFDLLREEMPELHHLNLKDVRTKHIFTYDGWLDYGNHDHDIYEDDVMGVLSRNQTIRSLILPSTLKRVRGLEGNRLMYSTLEIPEGVTRVGELGWVDYNGVEMILPSTIDSIDGGTFVGCQYKCELKLSDNISFIGGAAFGSNGGQYWESGNPNFYGVFHIPSKIKKLEPGMFYGLGHSGNISGTIELPQGITEIPDYSYWGGVFPELSNRFELILPSSLKRIGNNSLGGRLSKLQLNEGLEEIGSENFNGSCPFPLVLPSTLERIERESFSAGFEGELTIPEACLYIEENCFCGNEFTRINLPSRLETINSGCFRYNPRLTSVTLPRYVNYIGEGAFDWCEALQTVICLNQEPPELGGPIFQGVFFDKCVLQVPEASVELYRHTDGWKQFKNITAYHELAFNVPEILALDKGQTVEGVIRAEGAWEVSECPDWITISQMSGSAEERKTELTITVQPMSNEGVREGTIIFKLTNKEYTTYTTVRQVCQSNCKENQTIVLQEASAGAPRAIPIFIVGEGYDADDVVSGKYLEDMQKQMDYLFSCEPYKTYRNYFTVSTAIAVSPESGINGRVRFVPDNPWEDPDEVIWKYAKEYGKGINDAHAGQTTILVLYNSNYLGGNHTSLSDNGRAISYLGKSTDSYPFEQREFVLRELGGIAFGKLGAENVTHFTFLKSCTCPGCAAIHNYQRAKRLGWYENISISGKMNEVPWSHLIFNSKYATYVDVFEGAYSHARGVFRSENMSIMGDSFIPYFNTISRQAIVKRILEYSGEGYTFEKFVAKDKIEIPEE